MRDASEWFGRALDSEVLSTFVVFNQWILLCRRRLSGYFVFLDFWILWCLAIKSFLARKFEKEKSSRLTLELDRLTK